MIAVRTGACGVVWHGWAGLVDFVGFRMTQERTD